MSRFRFERYICGTNRADLAEIIVRSARLKAKVQIQKGADEITGIIEESSEEWLKIKANNLVIDINRETGLIKIKTNFSDYINSCSLSKYSTH